MENNTKTGAVNSQAENFICPNCGGRLQFDGKSEKFLCTSCGYEGDIKALSDNVREYSFDDYKAREHESIPFIGMSVAVCNSCGCEITFDERQTATVCSMCKSSQVDVKKQRAGIPPEGIIPFKVDKQDAAQKFREWVKGLWFAPTLLKKSVQEGNLNGKFVPFWTYDAEVFAPYTGQGGMNRTVKNSEGEKKTVTDWYPTAGVVSKSFDDIAVCAVGGEGASEIEAVAPFDTINSLKPFASEYLAGYNAEIYSIKADEAFETAKGRMKQTMQDLAESDVRSRFDTVKSVHISPKYTNVTYKHVLLPIWSSLFSYNNKTYHYVVNGETGNVSGERPYSVLKILRTVGIAVAIIAILCAIFFGGKANALELPPTQNVEQSAVLEQNNPELSAQIEL